MCASPCENGAIPATRSVLAGYTEPTLTYLAIHEGYGMSHSPHSTIIDNLIQSPAQLARLCACSHGTGPEKIVTHGVTMLGRQNGQ